MVRSTQRAGAKKAPAQWFKNYSEYLKSPQWKAKRELWFKTFGKWCRACGSRQHIILHHLTYERLGREPLSDLVALCDSCHKDLTNQWRVVKKQLRLDLRAFTTVYITKKKLQKASQKEKK